MYIVCMGNLEYTKVYGASCIVTHEDEQWVSEAALWTQWMHRGILKAMSNCRLVTLDATLFQDIVGGFEHLDFDPRKYAAQYVHHLNLNVDTVTDLPLGEETNMAKAMHRKPDSQSKAIASVRATLARALSRANSFDWDGDEDDDE
mmetsp:Transcript_36903/g.68009  ORF Transcript_36903/g.68009 Transcript_36903/m.68009 type:complete len:146 (+) Transcript_36903:2-439(+)